MTPTDPIAALKALADPTRLALAQLLAEGAFNVGEVQEVLDLGQSVASRHLKLLSDAGLVTGRRQGRLAYYQWRLDLPPAHEALRRFVREHGPDLPPEVRRRLHRIFAERAMRTSRFFERPGAAALVAGTASERAALVGADVTALVAEALPAHGTVVDLGTGAGRLLGALRDGDRPVIGVDASPRMLEAASRVVAERGWRDVELRLGALEHLPLADGEAKAAVAHQVLHHCARPEAALAEARRVLAEDGVLVIADYLPHQHEWMREELADQWLGFDPDDVARLLVVAGFVDVSLTRVPGRREELGMFVARAVKPAHLRAVPDRETNDVTGSARTRTKAATAPHGET